MPPVDPETAMAYLGALVTIARADGHLVQEERAWIRHVAQTRLGFEPDEEALFFSDVLWQEACGTRPTGQLGRCLVEDAFVLALIDGALNPAEARAIEQLGLAVGVDAEQLRSLLDDWSRR